MEGESGKSMRAVVVPFFQYPPQGVAPYYRVYFDYFLKQLETWKDEFDQLYVVDHLWNITQEDVRKLRDVVGDRYGVFALEKNYWENLSEILDKVLEDKVLVMDLDTIVYQKGIIAKNFDLLDEYDLVSTFDGSGGNKEKIWKKYPFLEEKGYLRIAPCFCFAKTKLLRGRDYMPYHKTNEDRADFAGVATLQILKDNPKIKFLEDDRSSIYLRENGDVFSNFRRDTGFYHIRNWALGVRLIIDRLTHRDYLLPITPVTEGCRLLAWLWMVAGKVDGLTEDLQEEILATVHQYNLKDENWFNYLEKFKYFHNWI